jgi:hypothetical protein
MLETKVAEIIGSKEEQIWEICRLVRKGACIIFQPRRVWSLTSIKRSKGLYTGTIRWLPQGYLGICKATPVITGSEIQKC